MKNLQLLFLIVLLFATSSLKATTYLTFGTIGIFPSTIHATDSINIHVEVGSIDAPVLLIDSIVSISDSTIVMCLYYHPGSVMTPSSTSDTFKFAPQSVGNYTVILKLLNSIWSSEVDCDSFIIRDNKINDLDTFTFEVVAPDALPNLERDKVTPPPSPFTNHIYINGLHQQTAYTLTNIHGQIVRSGQTSKSITGLESLPQGMYFLQIEGQVYKVLKE